MPTKNVSKASAKMLKTVPSLICAAALLAASNTYASEEHSDVEFEFTDGKIEIEMPEPGLFVFEADFEEAAPLGETDDPGFNNDEFLGTSSVPAAGSLLGFNIVGPLVYWNGTEFADAGSASITIEDVTPGISTSVIDSSTMFDAAVFTPGSEENIIGEADFQGAIHQHIDFTINDGLTGAYGLLFSLTTDEDGVMDSDTFGIFFNNGLSELRYEWGVDAFNASIVPIPAGVWLFASALGLLGLHRKRATA